VLVTTLGIGILHATRDLAVALVDVTQHMARLAEALSTLLVPHVLRDLPGATPLSEIAITANPLARPAASVRFDGVRFGYTDGRQVFEDLSLHLLPGQRTGMVGPSGGGKSTLLALLQRFYDIESGRILINGQDISQVTQESLRSAIAVVPQDVSLF